MRRFFFIFKNKGRQTYRKEEATMTEREKDSKHISLERARKLLGDAAISDEELIEVMNNLKQFCGIICAVYKQENKENKKVEIKKNEDEQKGAKDAA